MIRSLALFVLAAGVTSASAGIADSCIDKIASANQFKVAIDRAPIRALADAIDRGVSSNAKALLVDYSKKSQVKRAFLINFNTCEVMTREYVIHGGAIYKPEYHNWGERKSDGMLTSCIRPDGKRNNMTRPGLFITAGCHTTTEQGWTWLTNSCQGTRLESRDPIIKTSQIGGVVLHEHHAILNNASKKPMGQGCPAFPPGRLANMVKYGVMNGMLVYVYAPQCSPEEKAKPGMSAQIQHLPVTIYAMLERGND